MSTRKTPAKSAPSHAGSPPKGNRRRIPSLLTRPLGLLGWEKLEPVLLAALATEEPLLLIGRHGTAKSFLLERSARALGLTYRFYNASLINYDDLVVSPCLTRRDRCVISPRRRRSGMPKWSSSMTQPHAPRAPEQALPDYPREARAGGGTREVALSVGGHESAN